MSFNVDSSGFMELDITKALEKYRIDGPFKEPLVRCDGCNQIVFVEDLHKNGMCECSHTRMKNIRILNEKEYEQAKSWVEEGRLDPDWLALWVPKE